MAKSRMVVTKIENKNRAFYGDIGPYLASRDVAKEIGYHIYDDEKTEWFVCKIDSEVVAFANCRVSSASVAICSCYTLEQFRHRGAMRAIVRQIKDSYQTLLRVSANKASRPLFASEGFKRVRDNGKFVVMEFGNA